MAASTHSAAHGDLVLLGKYLHKVAEEALYPQLRLYRWGRKVPIPRNRGKTVSIPYFIKSEPVEQMTLGAAETGAPGTSFAVCAHNYEAVISGFHGFFKFTDLFWGTHEVPGVMAAGVRQLAADMGLTYEEKIRDMLAAAGTEIHGLCGFGASTTNLNSGNYLSIKGLLAAENQLQQNNAPSFEGDFLPAIVNPRQIYDIFSNAAGLDTSTSVALTQWLATPQGQQKYAEATVGTIGRLRIMTSTAAVPRLFGAGNLTAGVTGYNALVIAPGAFAVVDLAGAPPSIIIQPFGSAGTLDPTKKVMTVGIKAYWTTVAMDTANRLVRILSSVA